jgi:transketolase
MHDGEQEMKESRPHEAEDSIREQASRLKQLANEIRFSAMTMTNHSGLGHTGGDLSSADILATLYLGGVLKLNPAEPAWPQRDRFIMSKGHCSGAFYSTLAFRGFFPRAMLATFMDPLSMLNGHPDRNKLPGVEANTGPLGHGLPIAVGCALSSRMRDESWRTFVLTGDGELQEGSNWEAALTAQQYGLDNLVVIVDRNRIQQGDFTEQIIRMDPMAPKWAAFGFAVTEVDGHDHAALLNCFANLPLEKGKPTCIIANTVKGKGVSFAENKPAWHHGVPTSDQLELAAVELGVKVSR